MQTMIKKNTYFLSKIMTYDFYYKSLFLFCLSISSIFGQVEIKFDSFPEGNQLFQRNENDKAIVQLKGNVISAGYTDISIKVKRDNKDFYWKKQKLTYQNSAPFAFETEIKAELAEYGFSVYLFNGKDSVFVKQENRIVCGDVIIVYGQSNALADDVTELERYSGDNKFGRTVYEFLDSGDYQWLPTEKYNYWSAGLLGLEVQKQLIDKYRVPIAILNSAIGNKSIDELMARDENNHANPSFYYGRMVKKAKTLGYAKNVKAIIWRQGEWEAYDAAYKNDYAKKFEMLRKQFLEDFPSIKKIYTFQNNIYFYGGQNSGTLRDVQRTINASYPDCEVLSTLGTFGFDGLHYKMEGYVQSGIEVSRLIARDFLNSSDTLEINSPNIKSAYFSSKKDSLILEFDKNQRLVFPETIKDRNNNLSLNLKDYFYLDGKSVSVEKANSVNNLVILKFSVPQNATKVTYTPDFYTNDMLNFLPGLPPITNSRGVRALTFKDFPITANVFIPPVVNVVLNGSFDNVSKKRIELNWLQNLDPNKSYFLEKAVNTTALFAEIATLSGTQYNDYKVKKGVNYFYRLRIKQNTSNEITYSNIVELKIPFGTENTILVDTDAMIVYPNPIQKGKNLNLDVVSEMNVKAIRLSDLNNTILNKLTGNLSQYQFLIQTENLNSGVYFIEAILEDNTKLIKKFVVE
jgi:hypothetical protein